MERKLRRKAIRRRVVRGGLLIANVVALGIILVFVIQSSKPNSNIKSTTLASNTSSTASINPVDQVSAASIAQTVAAVANLPETPLVNGQVIAQQVTSMYTLGDAGSSVLSKPQVVTTAFKSNQDIKSYVVQAGDTVSSLAATFNVTSDSIRWSNNVYGNSLTLGTTLLIPPLSGIVYTVKATDTSRSLAQAYGSSESLIIAYNDAEIAGLHTGERIIIPGGTMPSATYYGFGYASGALGSYDLYQKWNCTWWVAFRWSQTGRSTMPLLGNAAQWYWTAKADGLAVSEGTYTNTPKVHAAAETSTRGYGHVVFVEGINPDGSVNISEMNISGLNTWYPRDQTVTYSTVSAATAASYLYIY